MDTIGAFQPLLIYQKSAMLLSLPVLMDLGLGFLFPVSASTSHAGGRQ